MKYGIELEFFVKNKSDKIVPAYSVTNSLDGNPVVGELKTAPHDDILDTVMELKKLIYLEEQKISKKGYKLCLTPVIQVDDEFRRALRKQRDFINRKQLEILEEFSIYPEGKLGEMLPDNTYKASLQINMSEHGQFSYPEYTRTVIEDKSRWDSTPKVKVYSKMFNYPAIILKLDKIFAADIKKTDRKPGVYAIKAGDFGERIEYRSLPNTVDLDTVISALR